MNIQELLNRLDAQNYGPNDSVVASAINHPITGLDKLVKWLGSNIDTINSPYNSSYDKVKPALDIAGLAQTGALPFAPSGKGTVGSIRRPDDIFTHAGNPLVDGVDFFYKYLPNIRGIPAHEPSLENSFDKVRDSLTKYYSKHYATEHDPLVRVVDNGLRFPVNADYALDYNLGGAYTNAKNIQSLFNEFGLGKFDNAMGNKSFSTNIIPHIERGDFETLIDAESIQQAADKLRGVRGTKQIATTPVGKYFENVNDLAALHQSTSDAKSLFTTVDKLLKEGLDEDIGFSIVDDFVRPYNTEINNILKSDYYKKTANTDRRVFHSGHYFDPNIKEALEHMSDILPQNRTLSLQDSIAYAIRHDAEALAKAEKAKNYEWQKQQFDSGDILNKYNDGHHWKKVTGDALTAEGEFLAHCVGTYEGKVNSGKSEIYSLRTPDGNPLYTIEWNPKDNKIVQIRGKANSAVKPEHEKYIEPFKNTANVYSNSPDYFKEQGISSFEDLLKNMDFNQ